jgi:hypothetical protein
LGDGAVVTVKANAYLMSMIKHTSISNDQLANELQAQGIQFLGVAQPIDCVPLLAPTDLIVGLAESSEARLRLALIPLFLRRPDFAQFVVASCQSMALPATLTLHCYYSAAVLLQQKYKDDFVRFGYLPDLFTKGLNIPQAGSPALRLSQLAQRHAELSGDAINWLGTYEHAAQRLRKHLQQEINNQSMLQESV